MSAAPSAAPVARKTADGENFPVASRLLPRRLRPCVHAFYAFARLADDVADDLHLDAETKLRHLDALERALVAGRADESWQEPAAHLRGTLDAAGVTDGHARHLLRAFRRDARGEDCRTWDDLRDYCRDSADPVGRFLLDLHGEDEGPHAASDALCAALQIINHIQDCGADWRDLGRCYLPAEWFGRTGARREDLEAVAATPALRAVLDLALDRVDGLLGEAAALPSRIRHRRLRLEGAVILELALALARRLRGADPLAARVALAKPARLAVAARGLVRGLLRP